MIDLVVIGGGITGVGIARLAARNGVRVALLERGDLMSGASSASSHMLHGGLRYLEHGRVGLVREALDERAIVGAMAPSLARPRRFMVPVRRGGRFGAFRLRAGLMLYDWLAGERRLAPHQMLRGDEALTLEPDLAPEGLRGAGIYSDTVMDDARLGLAVAMDAAAHGAMIHPQTEVTALRPFGEDAFQVLARTADGGANMSLETRAVINATGAWTDAVRRRLFGSLVPGAPDPPPMLRPSRGVHLLYPPLTRGHGMLLTSRADGRVVFVVPMQGVSLFGTTEIEVGTPLAAEALRPSVEEVRYLRETLREALPGLAGPMPIAVLSGVRPLLRSDEDVGHTSREHAVVEEHGVVTIAGGKYTTFRLMARDALQAVATRIGRRGARFIDSSDPLPVPPEAGDDETAFGDFVAGLVEHAFARRLEDVVRRRSNFWQRPDRGRAVAPRVAAIMAERLGWSAERQRSELRAFEESLWEEETLLKHSRID